MVSAEKRAIRIVEISLLAASILLFIFAEITGDTFYSRLATEALIFGGLALSVDLLLGLVGLLSLGQAFYFGFGAYLSAVMLKQVAPSFWLTMLVVLVTSALLGWVTSYIALRSRGVYFALITFGLAQVAAKVVYNTRALGASDGMIGVPILQIDFLFFRLDSSDPGQFFLLVFAVIALMYGVLRYITHTPMGAIWHGIRSNENRLAYVGFKSKGPKQVAFVIAAVIAAVSGALYPMLRGFVSPELLFFSVSGNAVVTAVLGGVGSLVGPLLGSVLLTFFKSVIGTWTVHHHIIIGTAFVIVVIFAPRGILGALSKRLALGSDRKGE